MKPRKFEEVHRLLVNITVGFFFFFGILVVIIFIMRNLSRPVSTPPIFPAPTIQHPSPSLTPVFPNPLPQPQTGSYFPYGR